MSIRHAQFGNTAEGGRARDSPNDFLCVSLVGATPRSGGEELEVKVAQAITLERTNTTKSSLSEACPYLGSENNKKTVFGNSLSESFFCQKLLSQLRKSWKEIVFLPKNMHLGYRQKYETVEAEVE